MRPLARVGEETRDHYPVFYSAFAWSVQSVETLWNTSQHTDQERQIVVYEHDHSAVFFFLSMVWSRKVLLFFLKDNFSVIGQTGFVQISGVFLSLLMLDKIVMTVSSTVFVHTHGCNQHKTKDHLRSFYIKLKLNAFPFLVSWQQGW